MTKKSDGNEYDTDAAQRLRRSPPDPAPGDECPLCSSTDTWLAHWEDGVALVCTDCAIGILPADKRTWIEEL